MNGVPPHTHSISEYLPSYTAKNAMMAATAVLVLLTLWLTRCTHARS